MQQFMRPSQLLELNNGEMEELWQWAYRIKSKRLIQGISGMPMFSIGRLIEFLIDYKVPLKKLMVGLAEDFHQQPDVELVSLLWEAVKIILKSPKSIIKDGKLQFRQDGRLGRPGGSMQQWVDRRMWKQLTDPEMSKLWMWNDGGPEIRLFNAPSFDFYRTRNLYDVPMLSIGRLLEYLIDNQMSLQEVFEECSFFDNKEWNKRQLMDVLWEKVKFVLRFPRSKTLQIT